VPSGLSNVVAISAFSSNSLALTATGDLVTWGNDYCQTNPLPADLTNVVSIAGGSSAGFALKENGSYVTWSCNETGRFVSENLLPVGSNNVVACAYSEEGRSALDSLGKLRARFRSVSFTNVMTNVVSAAIGAARILALTADGQVLSSGASVPNFAPDNLTNAVAVAANHVSSLVLLTDGKLVYWYTGNPDPVPVTLYEGTNVLAIAAAGSFQVALLDLDGNMPVGSTLPGPRIVTNGIAINIPTERGRTYVLEYKSSLTDPWSLKQLVAGNGAMREVVVPSAAQGFFRTRRVR
jgi:hypothetical protein